MSPQDFFDTVALEDISLSTTVTVNTSTLGLSPRFSSGRPIMAEDFELAWPNWVAATFGAGAVSQRQNTAWYSAGYAWELTVGAPGVQYAQVYAHLGTVPEGGVGISWAWALSAALETLSMTLSVPVGSHRYDMSVNYDGASGDIQVLDHTLGYVSVISNADMELSATTFHFAKLTASLVEEAAAYYSLKYNDHEVDVSAYSPQEAALVADTALIIAFTNLNSAAAAGSAYIDNVVLTINESA